MSAPLKIGFIALNDAAVLIAAHARGLFAAEGLEVELVREVSWATIRDKVNVGALDGAHMLAPLALATSVGAAGAQPMPLVAPFALALNGPAITLSSRLGLGAGKDAGDLARLIARRQDEGASPITLAVVFPFSTHAYLLRDWLARSGVDPERDIRLTVAPPARMTGLLVDGVVEGFCVTEPWDSAAVAAGAGRIAVRGSEVWPRTPDKVVGFREAWAEEHPKALRALVRAMIRAAAWVDDPENRTELVTLLSQPQYVGAPEAVIDASLVDMVFHADGANAPQPLHAEWLLRQMQRWGHVGRELDVAGVARRVYRADLYDEALATLGQAPARALEALTGFEAPK